MTLLIHMLLQQRVAGGPKHRPNPFGSECCAGDVWTRRARGKARAHELGANAPLTGAGPGRSTNSDGSAARMACALTLLRQLPTITRKQGDEPG